MKKLKELKKNNPNWTDLGREVRKIFTHITISGTIYYINRDLPNDRDLGKFVSEHF
jgi:hypothetical protein